MENQSLGRLLGDLLAHQPSLSSSSHNDPPSVASQGGLYPQPGKGGLSPNGSNTSNGVSTTPLLSSKDNVVLISSIIATAYDQGTTGAFKSLLQQSLQQSQSNISEVTQSHHERFLRSCSSVVELGDEVERIRREVESDVEEIKTERVKGIMERSENLRKLTDLSNSTQYLAKVLHLAIKVALSLKVAEDAAEEGRLKEALEEVDKVRMGLGEVVGGGGEGGRGGGGGGWADPFEH